MRLSLQEIDTSSDAVTRSRKRDLHNEYYRVLSDVPNTRTGSNFSRASASDIELLRGSVRMIEIQTIAFPFRDPGHSVF